MNDDVDLDAAGTDATEAACAALDRLSPALRDFVLSLIPSLLAAVGTVAVMVQADGVAVLTDWPAWSVIAAGVALPSVQWCTLVATKITRRYGR